MLKSKSCLSALFVSVFAFTASAQAEDILSILERNAQSEPVPTPKTIPYIYTVKLDIFGKDGEAEVKQDESGEIGGDDELPQDEADGIEKVETDKVEAKNFSAIIEINPKLNGAERVKIISHTGDPDSDELKDMLADFTGDDVTEADLAKEFWCGSDDDDDQAQFTDNIIVISETDEEAIVRPDLEKMVEVLFSSKPDDTKQSGDNQPDSGGSKKQQKLVRRMLKRMDAQLTLNKPDGQMKQMKIWMTRPMRVALIAKIKDMRLEASCELAPNGFRYQAVKNFGIDISALGNKVEQNVHQSITDLRPLP